MRTTNVDIFSRLLNNVGQQILDIVKKEVAELGGRVCFRHYHEFEDMDRNVFFEVDNNGYGRELFLDTLFTDEDGEMQVILSDTEGDYTPYWELDTTYFNASNALYLLWELEDIIDIVKEKGGKVVTDYDENFEGE